MKRAVEAPKLHRVVAVKETVQVKEVVAAAVVVLVAVFPVALVPDAFDLGESSWFDAVHPFYQISVHFLAVAHPLGFDLQRLIEQVVVAGDDVDEVADAPWGMVGSIQVDMNPARWVGEPARFPKRPHQTLQRVDVLPIE